MFQLTKAKLEIDRQLLNVTDHRAPIFLLTDIQSSEKRFRNRHTADAQKFATGGKKRPLTTTNFFKVTPLNDAQ